MSDLKGIWLETNKPSGRQAGWKTDFTEETYLVNIDTGAVLKESQKDMDPGVTILETGDSRSVKINQSYESIKQALDNKGLILKF